MWHDWYSVIPENNDVNGNGGTAGDSNDDCMAPCEWMLMLRCHCESVSTGEACKDYIKANWLSLFKKYDVNEKDCCLNYEEWWELFTTEPIVWEGMD